MLSILIPCKNESPNIKKTLSDIIKILDNNGIDFEIIIVDDYSNDNIKEVCSFWSNKDNRIVCAKNNYSSGYGFAVRQGLEIFKGDAVAIVMADGSDEPEDIIRYYQELKSGYECVFGTRFCRQSQVRGYPVHKLILNRCGNIFIQLLFLLSYNDITNAFKCYRRNVIDGIKPLVARHFNLTVEMPLKAIIRGYKWKQIPINWHGRKRGISKWKINEMGSRYLFIILYVWLEKYLSRGDYTKEKRYGG